MTEDEQRFWDACALGAIPLALATLERTAPHDRVIFSEFCKQFADEMLEERRAAKAKFSVSA